MKEPKIGEAILALDPNSIFVIRELEIEWIEDEIQPSEEQIQTKLSELQAEYDALEYQRDRLQEYPSIQECIHAILDDDLEALQAKRTAVKAKYPKPE